MARDLDGPDDALAVVLAYHERTRHDLDRSAPGPGRMDWSTEPDPFRRFASAALERLDVHDELDTPPYDRLFEDEPLAPAPVDRAGISRWLFFALAVSAWKEHHGVRWSLRVNPSSGDLHPTECYVVTAALGRPGLYHYAPREHALELRAELDTTRATPTGGLLAALTSVVWRESWKYGERAYRYCQQDLGHAVAALALSAAVLGWRVRIVPGVSDDELARWLGLDREDGGHDGERESPAMLLAVAPAAAPFDRATFDAPRAPDRWHGRANRLSPRHRAWPAIAAVESACRRPGGRARVEQVARRAARSSDEPRPLAAGTIIRRRRSALDLDGRTEMARIDFYRALLRTLPEATRCPFDALHWKPRVHLGLFVHRVEGLAPGLYALVRDRERLAALRGAMHGSFAWSSPEGVRAVDLPLYGLVEGDVRAVAVESSCHQEMAGAGAFCVAFLAELEPELRRHGAAFYRNLHWEAGMIAHVLYLEAEAAGLRGTGIGCFLDHPSHGAFGVRDLALQTIYHFTAGGPVEDPRLTTLPAFPPPADPG